MSSDKVKATVIEGTELHRIRDAIKSPHHRLFFDIACYTGQKWGAICQLLVTDVYADPVNSVPNTEIKFKRDSRLAAFGGDHEKLSVPVHPYLAGLLSSYHPDMVSRYLFPSSANNNHPISFSAAVKAFNATLVRAGLADRGFSTHSTRRTFATNLYRRGARVGEIQDLLGVRNLGTVSSYIERHVVDVAAAIALL